MSLQTGTRDMLIKLIKSELYHGFALGLPKTYASTMRRIEQMIDDHRKVQDDTTVTSKLKERVPTVGKFHTSLPLEEAWGRYDQKYCVSSRRNVPPSFNEVRHTMNLAQVMRLPDLELACFDGDGTLYTDQRNFSYMPLAQVLIMLMQNGVTVVLVTAAGYGYDGPKYEVRLRMLLDAFIADGLSEETLRRFMVLGGECNYLLRCNAEARLVQVPDEEWQARIPHPSHT
jgi:IMP and pyridine-specific 5'-nucleotidase